MGAAVMLAGCLKSSSNTSGTTPLVLNGTFTGTYTRYHVNANRAGYDTVKGNISVVLNSTGYKYNVTGDTSKHAPSRGSYGYDASTVQFNDSTYAYTSLSANANLGKKPHLAGVYTYIFDGTNLQLRQDYASDTLFYYYSLKK